MWVPLSMETAISNMGCISGIVRTASSLTGSSLMSILQMIIAQIREFSSNLSFPT